MLIEEARWFRDRLAACAEAEISPMLNVGSQTQHFRQYVQPWIDEYVFGPLARRGVRVVHTDMQPGDGVDVVGDLTDEQFVARLRGYGFRSLFCSNVLEHVPEPGKLAASLVDILPTGAWLLVSCPRVFPYHPDPVDTGFRPQVAELAGLFPDCELLEGEIVDCGMMWHYVVARVRAWWRERGMLARLGSGQPASVSSPAARRAHWTSVSWRRALRIALWLCRPVSATCVVMRVCRAEASQYATDKPTEAQ